MRPQVFGFLFFSFTRCLDAWVVFAVAGVSLFHFLLFKIIKPPFPHIDIRLDPSFPFCALFPVIIIIIFYLFIIFLLLSIFVDHFPSLFLVTTLLSTFLSLVLSPNWFPSHSFNGLFFSSTSTFYLCQHVLYMHSLTHWKPLVSVGKKTYCRSSFQTFNPFRVFHFPLNIPFVSRWSPPQIVRVNTFFDPKNKKLTL